MEFLNLKKILKDHKVFPRKRLGQNFLVDKRILKKIVQASEISEKDLVLEVGPGIGNLTIELAKRAKKVIAVEKDKRLVEILKENLSDFKNVEIREGDIREKISEIVQNISKGYKIVANIPYYLTSYLIRKFLELKKRPKLMVLMIQKEVAQRICSKPPKMNLLSISVQFFSKPEIVSFVSKNSFWPRPRVDSAIIRLRVKNEKLRVNKDLFFEIVKTGFFHPRKQLINNFTKKFGVNKMEVENWLLKNGVDPKKRAQEISLNEWIKLSENFPFKI
jgi:16S rRNA (adenine1518-N6/adenine1519-N6)-dimethyltransferase